MYEAYQRDTWVHTTHVLVTIANTFRDPKAKALEFRDVYPFRDEREAKGNSNLTAEQQELREQFEKEMRSIAGRKAAKELANRVRGEK